VRSAGLYLLRILACVLLLFGIATLAHGSGFLAVFAAGIVLADERAPFKRDIETFHASLAILAEIVAFVVLGAGIPFTGYTPDGWRNFRLWAAARLREAADGADRQNGSRPR
jgi:potassium/hydrogen antiporter